MELRLAITSMAITPTLRCISRISCVVLTCCSSPSATAANKTVLHAGAMLRPEPAGRCHSS